MGAESITQRIKGKTPADAFREAYEQARYEHGNGGYSGSMAESAGYFVVGVAPKLYYEAQCHADRMIDNGGVQKWGATALIPLADAVSKRTIELTVDITGLERDWDGRNKRVEDAVRAKLRAGEQIDDLRTQDGEKKAKIVTTVTEGKAVTGYAVKDGHGRTVGNLHPTLTAAKKAAQEFVTRDQWGDAVATITKVTLREGNKALVVVRKQPTKTTVKVSATVGKPAKGVTTQWIAAGIYSS